MNDQTTEGADAVRAANEGKAERVASTAPKAPEPAKPMPTAEVKPATLRDDRDLTRHNPDANQPRNVSQANTARPNPNFDDEEARRAMHTPEARAAAQAKEDAKPPVHVQSRHKQDNGNTPVHIDPVTGHKTYAPPKVAFTDPK